MNPQQLDQDVVNIAKAIRHVESGNKPVTPREGSQLGGASRYQYTHDTWKGVAQKYLGDANAPINLENENKATYLRIKEWKDKGYNVGQVASMWNAGEGKPNAYMENHRGVNDYGVAYDTPSYAQKVAQAYQQVKNNGQLGGSYVPPPQTEPFTPATQTGAQELAQQVGAKDGGLVSDISNSLATTNRNIEDVSRNVAEQNIGFGSGILQTAGQIAGGVGNVIDDAITNVPVVGPLYQGASDVIGGAVQGAMSTAPGQAIQEKFQGLSPETQGNIGAALNIASIVPFFKALKFGKTGVDDALTKMSQPKIEAKAAEELKSSLNQTTSRGLARAEGRGLDPMKTIVTNQDYLPDVIESNGKFIYDTKKSAEAVQKSIETDELALQNLLKSTISQKAGIDELALNINDIRKQTIDDVMSKAGLTGGYTGIKKALNDYFDAYGDALKANGNREFINLSELNEIKRDVRQAINFDAIDPTGTLAKQAKFDAGQSLMRQVEEAAKKKGIKTVGELNKKMGTELQALDVLEFLNGRPIKAGSTKDGLIKSVAKTIPGVEGVVDYASRGIPSTPTRRLKSKSPLRETGKKGLVQLGTGMALSNQLGSEQ